MALGYPVVLVSDGHSTVDNGVLSAAQISAHHNKTLASIESFGAQEYGPYLPMKRIEAQPVRSPGRPAGGLAPALSVAVACCAGVACGQPNALTPMENTQPASGLRCWWLLAIAHALLVSYLWFCALLTSSWCCSRGAPG